MKKMPCLILAAVILILAGCSPINPQEGTRPRYQNYKEIPGVTQAEIDAVEDLLVKKPQLIYGVTLSTDAFLSDDGLIGGFASLFCNRMSELLGFDFDFYPCNWNELNEKFVSKEIDLVGDFTATPERLQKYIMTDAIVQKVIKIFIDKNSEPLIATAKMRPIRCAFVNGSTTYSRVADSWEMPFEPVFINDQSDVPGLFLRGEIDAFIEEGTLEAAYDKFEFIIAEDFYPLTYSPVSLSTCNPELKPIIDVMQKYLRNGGYQELTELYNQGYKDYLKYRLLGQLTDEEKEYIRLHNSSKTAVSVAYDAVNYPTSFYNAKEKEFQGVASEILDQTSSLTGLVFKAGTTPDTIWPDLLDGLENGNYAVTTELLRTPQREGRFLWTSEPYYFDNYAMISNAHYPDVDINQIRFARVGLLEGTAYAELFQEWFPDSENTVMYRDRIEACDALEKGEIDLLMGSQSFFLHLTNYLERPEFKVNTTFNYSAGSYFGFNKDEAILCSIIDKAQRFIDTDEIAARWQRKVLDYESRMAKDMLPYIVVFMAILLAALIVVFILFIKNKKINKNLEKLVLERTGALERQTATLSTIYNSIPDLVFCKDVNGIYTSCNPSFEAFAGCSEAELIGKDDIGIFKISEEMAALFMEADKRVLNNDNTEAIEELITYPDGSTRLMETIKTPLIQNGTVIGIMGISRDITRRKAAEEEARVASRAKGDFLSRMSHEIRTPLNAIIGMIGIAMGTDDNIKIQNCLGKADNASKHLLGVINDILDMSKIEADKFELDSREFNFEKMLMNVTNVTNFRAEEKKQNFIVNLNRNVPESIVADDLRLSQVITNLLTNAVKFTPEYGTVILNIDKTEDNGDEVTLRVEIEDNGIGISKEQQKRLFTSFEQADGGIARKFGGTGLGLAISKRIVELMGGRIWVESELGNGSKFIFTMKAGKGRGKAHSKLSEKINRGDMRILAVDSSLEIREYFKHVLESLSLPCDVAENGAEALDMVRNCGDKPYNIFFIDWQIPEMNGIELTKKIKKVAPDNSVVFMISVAEWSAIEKEALAVGVRSFISKPLFPSTLVNAINECMDFGIRKSEIGGAGLLDKRQMNFSDYAILVAEDVEINREIISAVLEDTGINIDYAENGLMAVSMFSANFDKYSLILMDIHMPEMDGYEATRRIRALELPRAKDIPIIAMTANVFREDIENCLAAGMNDHLGKPVDTNDLYTKLSQYLTQNMTAGQ